jgi:hypothetical protein
MIAKFCGVDKEENEWLKRNYLRSMKLSENDAEAVAELEANKSWMKTEKIEYYFCANKPESVCFGDDNTPLVPFRRLDEYLWT